MKSDGIRGRYGEGYITPDVFYRIPSVLKAVLNISKVVVGRDPRPSSEVLHQSILDGATTAGIQVLDAGIMPTPMLSRWAVENKVLALMITASHNPATDNGLKIIAQTPISKFSCDKINQYIHAPVSKHVTASVTEYATQIKAAYLESLSPMQTNVSCLVDCAHGAWHPHLDVLTMMGVKVTKANLFNPSIINSTGALHASLHQEASYQHDYVICLDGDGDRLQLCRNGRILDGDDMLYHLACQGHNPVVTTEISNHRLIEALAEKNIQVFKTAVGDAHVRREIHKVGARFGAEPCGHILDINWLPYSDPVYMFLYMMQSGEIQPLNNKYLQAHQTLPNTADINAVKKLLLMNSVRSVVRYSETEPVIRVMLEGDQEEVQELVVSINAMH